MKRSNEYPDWEQLVEYFHPLDQAASMGILEDLTGLDVEELLNSDRYQYWLLINKKWY